MKPFLFLFTLLFAGYVNLISQSPIPILRGDDFETLFIDQNGKEAFRLPEGHLPVMKYPSSGFIMQINASENQSFDAFRDGICVVRNVDGSFYWINEKGFEEKMKKLKPNLKIDSWSSFGEEIESVPIIIEN